VLAFFHTIVARIRGFLRPGDLELDFEQETATHLEMAEADGRRRGLSAEEARRVARVQLGGITQLRESRRAAWGLPWLDGFALDAKLGLRMLRRSWGLTLAGGLAMTIVITIAAVVFVFLDEFMGRTAPPLDQGERVVALQSWDAAAHRRRETPRRDIDRWGATLRSVEDLGGFQTIERRLIVANRPADLQSFLAQVETFATTDYALALMKGNELPEAERQRIAQQLSAYTGLSIAYLLKTNLRIEYGAFQKELLADREETVGTLDTRFIGATLDPIAKVASNDPQSSAISSAYVAAYNDYVRASLRYEPGIEFKSGISIYDSWDYKHKPPGGDRALIALPNVLPDLAVAMKQNPDLKVMVNGGYYDVSTPYFAGRFEMRHLPIPDRLKSNIEYRYYESGHMVYAHLPSLKAIHDNVAQFIGRTEGR